MDAVNPNVERDVLERYAGAAEQVESALCCAVSYDPKYLEVIPQEVIDKDYGCGDPSEFARPGDVVLDLGSGSGKICYIVSQIVGAQGRVIGVDFNPAMLDLARKHQQAIAKQVGWDNTDFRYGKIQDLKTDYEAIDRWLKENTLESAADYVEFERHRERLAQTAPLVESNSVDLIVSNCVLNLVRAEDKAPLFSELYRVLKNGGRVAISDIVSDEVVPQHLRDDPKLWSGCISGAYEERAFLRAFEEAGFYGIEIAKRDAEPWQVVEGIEFRSVTVTAYKCDKTQALDRGQAVLYKGPWAEVIDESGNRFERGVPTAVSDETFETMGTAPYVNQVVRMEPAETIPEENAQPFSCCGPAKARKAQDLKGGKQTSDGSGGCC